MGHPSSRHSSLNWTNTSDNELWRSSRVTEVVLQAGDVLYLPTHWFHMIVSLDLNIQCNTRSGIHGKHTKAIEQCGYHNEY